MQQIQTSRPYATSKVLALCLALSGCSWLAPKPAPDIGGLRAQHHYVSALHALEQRQSRDPAYLAARQAVLDDAMLFQSQLLQTLRGFLEQQDFVQAQQLLDATVPELPPSAELTAFLAEFTKARGSYVQDKLDELYQLRGEHLLKEQPLYQSLQGIAGDDELQVAVERYQADANYFAGLLSAAGTQAMARDNFVAAQKYFATANQLRPSPELAAAITALETEREARQEQRLQAREQRYRKIETTLLQALAKSDYSLARTTLASLRETGLHVTDIEQYRRRLNEAIASYVSAQIDAGNKSYAESHIETALEHWRNANQLQSSPELKERIEKAEKFIQRYESLKQQPAPR